jgi:hypothetical protein
VLKYFLWLLPVFLFSEMIPLQMAPADRNLSRLGKIAICDTQILSLDTIDGEKFFGISALAYDRDTHTLYMLSDRSRLFAFDLRIDADKIVKLKPLWGRRLRDRNGHKYFLKESDSEGMTLISRGGKKYLLISFEQKPRVLLFNLEGREVGMPVQKSLSDLKEHLSLRGLAPILRKPFSYRKNNQMLESVAFTKAYATVVTPEFPLRKTKGDLQGLYNHNGRICYFKRHGLSLGVTELESLPDGSLLALQRGVHLGRHIKIETQLLKIDLKGIRGGICPSESLFHASTDEGWALDNFEGLCSVGENRFLMVSDDNGNFFQKTILVLFKLR